MKKHVSKFISILLVLALVVIFVPTAARAAEGDPLTLTVKDNDIITITATGYTVSNSGNTENLDYTGSYLLTGTATGTNGITVEGLAEGATLAMQDLSINSTDPIPLTVKADTTIAATGTVSLTASSPAVYLHADLTITGDADITMNGNSGGILTAEGTPALDITCKNLRVESNSPAIDVFSVNINAEEEISAHSANVYAVSSNAEGLLKLSADGDISLSSASGAPTVYGPAEIYSTGNIVISNPNGLGVHASSDVYMEAGGDITVDSANLGINTKTVTLKAGGDIALNSDGNIAVSAGLIAKAGGDITVSNTASSPTITGTADLTADGNISVTNGGNGIAVTESLTAEAGGDITIGNNSDSPTIIGVTNLTAGGDVSVTNGGTNLAVGSSLTAVGNNITVSNGDTATAPAVSGDLTLTAVEDITLSTGNSVVASGSETLSFSGTLTRTTSEGTTVSINVAQVGDKKYTTLGASVEAAQSGEDHTVTLLADTTQDGFVQDATVTGTVTIDLNGHTIESDLYVDGGSLTVTGSGTITYLKYISGTVDLSGTECLGWGITNWGDTDEDDNPITVERLEVGKNLILPGNYVLKNDLGDYVTSLDVDDDATVSLPPVARVERVEGANTFVSTYVMLDEAIEYAGSSEGEVIVTLLADIDGYTLIDQGTFTLDLNGYTLTHSASGYPLDILNDGTAITITDSSEAKTGKIDAGELEDRGTVAVCVYNGASLTIQGGTFCGTNSAVKVGAGGQNEPATLIVEGGVFQGSNCGLNIETNQGDVTVKGGSISGEYVTILAKGDLTITGTPKLTSENGAIIEYRKGTVDLSGAKCSGWSVNNYADADLVVGTDLLLPKDHCVYIDGDVSAPVSVIAYFETGIILDHVHTDAKADHLCDICGEQLSDCKDENRDHQCDICGRELTSCSDNDGDYVCDICGADMERPTDPTKPVVPPCKKDETCILAKYTDVITNDWYHDGVHFCVAEGLMKGMSDTTFAPNDPTTRAQLVMMLYRLEGEPSIEGMTEPFTDVAEADWFYAPIVWAYNNKVVNGMSDTTFEPNTNVSREQVATILYRYLESPEGTGKLDTYPDVDKVQAYAKDALVWAVGEGLINGVAQPDGTSLLDPAGNATRAQIATILMRYLLAED